MILPKCEKNFGAVRKEKILIGEFDPFLRGLLVECLEDAYEVVAVDCGDDLERELRNRPYDLVLREVILPGKPLADIARALPEASTRIPCILMVNGEMEVSPVLCGYRSELAVPLTLPKPFGLEALFGQIRRALGEASVTAACAIGRSA